MTVRDRVYHGASTEWIVETGPGERFTVLAQNTGADLPFPPGDAAVMVWERRCEVVLRG